MIKRWVLPTLGLLLAVHGTLHAADQATGKVFQDANRNGKLDADEDGIQGVLVSNQREVTKTDSDGNWALPARDDCNFFVVKPSGWMTPVNDKQLPQFYYTHKPDGSPDLKYKGVKPTGPLPESINFPLYRNRESGEFEAIFFADPQARDQKELDYIAHDVVEELIGTDAEFGVTLGDIMFDDLSLFSNHNKLIALIGVPWYNVIGNHDINYDSEGDPKSDETFERVYGPNYYAYSYGPVNFVVLDNVRWDGSNYHGGLGDRQLAFVENLLPHIPEDELIMFMMHIPLPETEDRKALFRLIEDRPYTMSISGHRHWQAHFFLDKDDGWRGDRPHHHVVNVTVSGSWWSGEPDAMGIPHTRMADGAPNGYSIITFDGHKATVDFKAARRPKDYQMHIHAPEVVSTETSANHQVYANVFGGSKRTEVNMRIGNSGEWIELKKVREPDPYFLELKQREAKQPELAGRKLPSPMRSHHLWKADLPSGLEPGIHRIWVRSEDMYGRVFNANRVIRVK